MSKPVSIGKSGHFVFVAALTRRPESAAKRQEDERREEQR